MSVNKLVPIRNAIFNACEDMGIDFTSQIPTLTRWAVDAEKKIGSYYGWKKKRAVLDIKGCRAKLPCGTMKVQYVLIGDHGCDCEDLINKICSIGVNTSAIVNETFLVIDVAGDSNITQNGQRWEVQNNHIVFQNNLDAQKCTIQYLGYEEDEDGFIMVNENHVLALACYIKAMYAERSRFSPIKMETIDVRNLYNRWIEEKSIAIAEDSQLSESERNDIVSMLTDPFIGYSLDFNMH